MTLTFEQEELTFFLLLATHIATSWSFLSVKWYVENSNKDIWVAYFAIEMNNWSSNLAGVSKNLFETFQSPQDFWFSVSLNLINCWGRNFCFEEFFCLSLILHSRSYISLNILISVAYNVFSKPAKLTWIVMLNTYISYKIFRTIMKAQIEICY